jgi:polyhydroxybutyrate depolymerase
VRLSRPVLLTVCLLPVLSGVCLSQAASGLQYFTHDGLERSYILRVPDSYIATESHALVLVLHGGGGNAVSMEESTGFTELASREGFIVVYPNGTGRFPRRLLTWNSGYIELWASENDVDDSGFLAALTERLSEVYSIDRSMIFVTGMSNGAMMAYRAAAEHPDVFSAVGAVAGAIGGRPHADSPEWVIPEPSSPVSAVIFHGTLDSHVRYDGGETGTWIQGQQGRIDMSVAEAVQFFVDADWCDPVPAIETLGDGTVIRETWSGGDHGTEVVLYTVTDSGHSWPGSSSWLPGDPPTDQISATELIWEFFEAHPAMH